jgi:hypothetical protein
MQPEDSSGEIGGDIICGQGGRRDKGAGDRTRNAYLAGEALGSKVKVIVGPWIHLNCRG